MSRLRYIYVLSLIVLHCKAERRILEGKKLTHDRRYMVYMVKASASVLYDAWICGGAIVSPWYILTSAACMEDVKHMYAIAGYKKYVTYEGLSNDACTSSTKKKIVYVCLPTEYDFDYPRVERWANIDVALVKVESAYNFNDASYRTSCSYIPNSIEINYDQRLQEPGTNALVFGWGHTKKWRSVEDVRDYNQDDLLYGSVVLAPKEQCKTFFDQEKVKNIIDKYMICSMDGGHIDDEGGLIDGKPVDPNSFKTQCGPGTLRMGDKCVPVGGDGVDQQEDGDLTRRNANFTYGATRRKGICQNDHGGPIVSWRGPKEVLIGISSVFRVDSATKQCIPPFLYTSTHCNGAFLNCLMTTEPVISGVKPSLLSSQLNERCDALAREGGFKIVRRTISWIGHPDGPAANEIHTESPPIKKRQTEEHLILRPQIPFEHIRNNTKKLVKTKGG